jgi:hypothetical protein
MELGRKEKPFQQLAEARRENSMSKGARAGLEFSGSQGRRGPAGDLQRHGPHLFVDQPVGGENDGAAKLVRISGEIAHFPAGFFN